MRRTITATLVIGMLLFTTGIASAYTASFTVTLDDMLFTTWKPPHDESSSLNYTYNDYTFVADSSIAHIMQVFDDPNIFIEDTVENPDPVAPVLYLYESSFNPQDVTSNLIAPSLYPSQSLVYSLTANTEYHLVTTTNIPVLGVWTGDFAVDINSVPIPAAAWLLVSGLIGLVGVKRKF